MRLFVGIFPPEDVRKKLYEMGRFVKGEWKREPPEKLHITLKFMPDEDPQRIMKALENVEHPSFDIEFTHTGVFPHRGRPRVIWLGARGEGLFSLKRAIDEVLNIPDDKPFVPHLTLGRVKGRVDVEAFLKEGIRISMRVTSFRLVSSTLTPGGSVYKTVKEYGLQD